MDDGYPDSDALKKTCISDFLFEYDEIQIPSSQLPENFKEGHIVKYVKENMSLINDGLKDSIREHRCVNITQVGIIDILCKDANDNYVVIEFKKGHSSDQAIGQLLRYIGYVKHRLSDDNHVYGYLITDIVDQKISYSIYALENPDLIKVKKYCIV